MRTIELIYPGLFDKRAGNKLAIRDENQLKHLSVLRATDRNYRFRLIDGAGTVAAATLKHYTKEGALFEVTEIDKAAAPQQQLTLLVPIVRLPALEQAVEQASQFGIVVNIHVYFSDFTRYTERRFSEQKLARLQRLSEKAVRQSQGVILPQIMLFDSMAEAFTAAGAEQWLMPDTAADQELSAETLLEARTKFQAATQVGLLIGPEGGFSDKEQAFCAEQQNVHAYRFGEAVLTSETATVAFMAMMRLLIS